MVRRPGILLALALVATSCGGGRLDVPELRRVDLTTALLTLEDLPAGSTAVVENADYAANPEQRLILCGTDVRRELRAITGRASDFRGSSAEFLWLSHVVSGLAEDQAGDLLDRTEEVGSGCDRTWRDVGLDGEAQYEVVGPVDVGDLGDQTVAFRLDHRQASEVLSVFLVLTRIGQFTSAFLLITPPDADEGFARTIAGRAATKLDRAVEAATA